MKLFFGGSRVDRYIDHTLEQAAHTHKDGGEDGDAHDHGIVPVLCRLPRHPAHAGPIEHLLNDHGAAEDERYLGSDDLGHGYEQALLERMFPDRGALGPSRADVVLAHHPAHLLAKKSDDLADR